jgi:hypothetical protein
LRCDQALFSLPKLLTTTDTMDSQPDDTSYSEFFPDIPAGETDFAQSEWAATIGHHDFSDEEILMQSDDVAVSGQLMPSTDQETTQCEWALMPSTDQETTQCEWALMPSTDQDDGSALSEKDDAETMLLEFTQNFLDGGNEVPSATGSHKRARTMSEAKKNRFIFEQTIQIWNGGFDPSFTAQSLSLIYELYGSSVYTILSGNSRAIITKRLSKLRPTPLRWFKNVDDAFFEKANLRSPQTDQLEKVFDQIFSNCPDYQSAISGNEYMHKALDISASAINRALIREEYMPDALKYQRESICTEVAHIDKAEENKTMFLNTVEIANSKYFHFNSNKDIESSFPDTKNSAICQIQRRERRYDITKHLSRLQPTPTEWFTSIPAIVFEKLFVNKLERAGAIFEQSPAYQEAIRGDDYMHKPLPRIKPEGFSYWKTYMPSLKGVVGDLTPIRK